MFDCSEVQKLINTVYNTVHTLVDHSLQKKVSYIVLAENSTMKKYSSVKEALEQIKEIRDIRGRIYKPCLLFIEGVSPRVNDMFGIAFRENSYSIIMKICVMQKLNLVH